MDQFSQNITIKLDLELEVLDFAENSILFQADAKSALVETGVGKKKLEGLHEKFHAL